MPLVEITMMDGRSADQKRALMAEVTDAVVRSIGAPRETIRVAIREIPAEHWGIGGVSVADLRAQAAAKTGESGS